MIRWARRKSSDAKALVNPGVGSEIWCHQAQTRDYVAHYVTRNLGGSVSNSPQSAVV